MPASFISFLAWIEASALGVWVGESQWGFPISLTLHAFGMGMLAGGNLVLALRLLGFVRSIPPTSLLKIYPLLWCSAVLSLISGVMLLSAYPAKALTNPVFYSKLTFVVIGLCLLARPVRHQLETMDLQAAPTSTQRRLGIVIALLWLATITAGRFLAYTHSVLRVNDLTGG
ncbi:MAG: DUF6644 family protein [Pseudomonadota bacterium]